PYHTPTSEISTLSLHDALPISDAGARAAVEAGRVPLVLQPADPVVDEPQDRRLAGALAAVVGLHVEVDRRAGRDAERPGLAGGVHGGLPALRRGVLRGELLRAAAAGRLQADVGGQDPVAHRADLAHPPLGEVRLRASARRAAHV